MEFSTSQSIKTLRINSISNYTNVNSKSVVSPFAGGGKAGGGPPWGWGRAPGARRPKPPFPREYGFGVCGFGKPRSFFISHLHLDEIPAVSGATIYAAPPLLKELCDKLPFYAEENKLEPFEGEYVETQHAAFFEGPNGVRLIHSTSYCYVIGRYAYIDESFECERLLNMFRERGLTPLYHWQPRAHVNLGRTITHRDLPDGYLLDPRTWHKYENVIPKCVPSLLDVFTNPALYKGNTFAKYANKRR